MMREEQDVEYKTKIAKDMVRDCILGNRMISMMGASFAFDEILEKFTIDGYKESEIIQTYNLIICAGEDREKIEL